MTDHEAKIIERATAKKSEIILNAEKRAVEIIDNAKKEAENIIASAKREAHNILESDLRAVRGQILGEAEMEGRKMLANTKEAILSRVFKEAERKMIDIVNGKNGRINYGDVLLKLIEEAALNIGEEELIIVANERDREYLYSNLHMVEEAVSKVLKYNVKLHIDRDPLDCIGGVVVYNSTRRKIYHNTLEGRLLKSRKTLEATLAKTLFGG